MVINVSSFILLFLSYLQNDKDKLSISEFLIVMKGILAVQYGITILAFVPLFIIVVKLMIKNFQEMY